MQAEKVGLQNSNKVKIQTLEQLCDIFAYKQAIHKGNKVTGTMSGYIVATSEAPANIDELKQSEIVFSFEDSREKNQ